VPLERHRRLVHLWNWLPAFRAVAEAGSLQRAASKLRVSASSLSRTIKLLEAHVGCALFVRSAGGVTPTERGLTLLQGTREAMRRVDEALPGGLQRVTLGLEGPLLSVLAARGLSRLAAKAEWAVTMHELSASAARAGLFGEALDLALLHAPVLGAELQSVRLAEVPWAIAGEPGTPALISCCADAPMPLTHLVSSLEAARVLAEALPARLLLPQAFVPQGFRVLEVLPQAWEIFATWRTEVIPGEAAHLGAFVQALRDALA
jgi:DNA-binding transcriptional LysR family regulator